MFTVEKPKVSDLENIKKILTSWTDETEVDKYIARIIAEINGHTEFNLHFWVAKDEEKTVGIIGLCDPLPKILKFAKSQKSGEIKILYLDPAVRGKGVGKLLESFIEKEAAGEGYKELLIRSAERYRETAYGFYEKMGFNKVGLVEGGESSEPMQVFEKLL